MRIYIAAPLFSEAEIDFNRKLRKEINGLGHKTFLPQEDGTLAFEQIKQGAPAKKVRQETFDADLQELRKSDAILCVLDGRVTDEGVCIELGLAYALEKKCIGLKTDTRSLDQYGSNLMIEGCLSHIFRSKTQLFNYLKLPSQA